jgi:DNA-binding MarR family transcriptional regulator
MNKRVSTEFDVTDAEVRFLQAIQTAIREQAPNPPSNREIAKVFGSSVSDVSKYLFSLEAKKFIRRERKSGSEKKKYRGVITFTDKGKLALIAADRRKAS